MKAITFQEIGKVSYQEVQDPQILEPGDAIVRVGNTAICGSDMHVYHGREKGIDPGTAMGHEFEGTVVETGQGVKNIKTGDRVVSPFTTSCGECYYCRAGLTARCIHGALFGWVQEGQGLQGAQAEYVRVPYADATLVKYPSEIPSVHALLSGDILSTAYYCATMAEIQAGRTYAVIGCGPVGLLTIMSAIELGASSVFAVDAVPYRLQIASELGAIPLNLNEDPVSNILSKNNGRGCDSVMEAVGSPDAQKLAFEMVRAGGIISTVGVHTETSFSFSPIDAYDKNLTFKIGRCPARHYMDIVLPMLSTGRFDPDKIITHRLPLSEGVRGYELFDKKLDNCLKIILESN